MQHIFNPFFLFNLLPAFPQMENGCILNSSYSLNGAAPPAVQIPGPETLPSLPDPPATGFYL